MKAVIELDVPEWQIGQDVSVYFPDTMVKHGKCELLKEQEPMKVEWHIGRAHCPSCGELFSQKKETQYIRFCSYCGQAVKLE